MVGKLLRLLGRVPRYRQMLAAEAAALAGAALLAPAIYYAVAGPVPWPLYVATLGTVAVVVLPLVYLFVSLADKLRRDEIRAVRARQANERKNRIFRSLLNASLTMQKSEELIDLLDSMLAQLHQLFRGNEFGVIIEGTRPKMIKYLSSRGISEAEKGILIENNGRLLTQEAQLVVERLRRVGRVDRRRKPLPDWSFLPVHGRGSSVIGKVVIKGPPLDPESREIIAIFVEQMAAATENKLLSLELEKLANTDALTGVFNRTYFKQELEHQIRLKRDNPGVDFCLMLVDLNSLKSINDEFGHTEGDRVIIEVGRLLVSSCRREDIVCRIGGDEFVVLCPSTGPQQMGLLVDRIQRKTAEALVYCENAKGELEAIEISLSIGVAGSADGDPYDVFRTADARMYRNKQAYYERQSRAG